MVKYIVKLTQEERNDGLLHRIKGGKESASKLMHARVLLAVDAHAPHEIRQTDAAVSQARTD